MGGMEQVVAQLGDYNKPSEMLSFNVILLP
jgi:hypothetical protein